MPGYADLFPDDGLWTRPVALAVAQRAGTAEALRRVGIPGVSR